MGAASLPYTDIFLPVDLAGERILPLGTLGYWFYLGFMILCIIAMVNLEAVFSSLRGVDRWRMKFELLGVGSILAGYIFYFSQGLLFRSVNMGLLPVRSGILVAAALMIGYSRIFRGQAHKVSVSRQVFYRSFTLLAVGLYLIVLGLVGEGMKRFHVSLSLNLMLLVAFGSGLLLFVLLLSEVIRSRVRVFIAKHFYAHKHDYREEWLSFSNSLAVCQSLKDVEAAVVETYRTVFGLRFAALYLRGGGSAGGYELAHSPDRKGLPAEFTPSEGLRCYFAETGRVLNPRDGECTPTGQEVAFFREADAWLMVPLMAGDRVEALVLFGGQITSDKLTYEDFDLMKVLGRQAVLSLNNFRLSGELAETREIAAVAKVSSFVIHDLKNLAYTFSLMMENTGEHIGEPDFQRDLVKSIQGTVAKMNALIAKLKAFPEKTELKREATDLARLTREVLDEVQGLKKTASFETDLVRVEAFFDASEIRKVVLNLLLNACDAVGAHGLVRITTCSRGADAVLRVEDNGRGMSPAFVQGHLFKPFRTTKEKGLGIGLYQSKQIVEAHGGRIEVASREGEGTTFTVILPLQETAARTSPVSAPVSTIST